MKISFCTTCANRWAQFARVFAANCAVIGADRELEWVIVNFGSRDGFGAALRAALPALSARIVYAETRPDVPWHLSVAKNTAHRAASGDVVFNLDCDNLIGDGAEAVRQFFPAGCRALHLWSRIPRDGTCGRIALTRELFARLGGYDESFFPMGYQDLDLLQRATALGALVLQAPCDPRLAIRNSKEDSVRHCDTRGLAWMDYLRANRERSAANIAAGRLRANAAPPPAAEPLCILRGGRADL